MILLNSTITSKTTGTPKIATKKLQHSLLNPPQKNKQLLTQLHHHSKTSCNTYSPSQLLQKTSATLYQHPLLEKKTFEHFTKLHHHSKNSWNIPHLPLHYKKLLHPQLNTHYSKKTSEQPTQHHHHSKNSYYTNSPPQSLQKISATLYQHPLLKKNF